MNNDEFACHLFLYTIFVLRRPKSSFLPSYIIDVRELDEKLLNIIDMKFLHGYYEPTLLILFEPNQTWPGSVKNPYFVRNCPSFAATLPQRKPDFDVNFS